MFLYKRLSISKKRASVAKPSGENAGESEATKTNDVATKASAAGNSSTNVMKGDPVRLLISQEFVKFTDGVPFYEIVPSNAFIEVSFEDFMGKYYQETAVISWRWKAPKPSNKAAAEAAVKSANPVPKALVLYVKDVVANNPQVKYLWLDWSCAPQYPVDMKATMREINRSGNYYNRASTLIVWCFDELAEDAFEYSDYFNRAWTLSERLNRSRAERYLTGFDLIPLGLTKSLSEKNAKLRVDEKWEVHLNKGIAALQMADRLTFTLLEEFTQTTIIKRYPLLNRAFEATTDVKSGSLMKVLTAPVLTAISFAVQLKAVSEWIKHPDQICNSQIVLKLGLDPKLVANNTVNAVIQAGRMRMNNLPDKHLNNSLEDFVGIGADLQSATDQPIEPILERLDAQILKLYKLALEQKALEVADATWLKRYLSYEIANYNAFAEQDKLFAVYKLFDGIPDRTYDEVAEVWNDLCKSADMKYLTDGTVENAWLCELSVVQSEQDVGRSFFGTNSRRKMDCPSSHPLNFGVLAYPPTPKAAKPQSIASTLFREDLIDGRPNILTYLLGFNLGESAAANLGKIPTFKPVDKAQGTEIDTHLSLRGRKALEHFENDLHEMVRKCFSISSATDASNLFVTEKNNGFFVCVRYDGERNLSKCVLIRTSLVKANIWTLEAVGCFTGEPQKGSSWGIAKCIDNLVNDILALGSDVEFACKQFGKCDPWSETVKLETASKSATTAPFLSEWVLDTQNLSQPPSSYRAELLSKTSQQVSGDDIDMADLMVIGKTSFEPEVEFKRVKNAFRLVIKSGGGGESLNIYYKILQRNYLVDTVMAQKIQYFGDLCEILAEQIQQFPRLLEVALIKQFFDYLVEDMIDAVDMAEDRVSDDVLEKVRGQRRNLMNIVENDA